MLGTEKVRITGGEPLLRKHLERLIEMLASLGTLSGKPLDLTLTTNGALLRRKARNLREAGLSRLTVSLDAIDDRVFRKMNDVEFPVADVLDGLNAANEAGFTDIKVNMVVQRGVNEHQILPMIEYFRHSGHILRFIEFMDVGSSNGWTMTSVFSSSEILKLVESQYRIHQLAENYAGEVARRWAFDDGSLEFGLIASVSEPFVKVARGRACQQMEDFTAAFSPARAGIYEVCSEAVLPTAILLHRLLRFGISGLTATPNLGPKQRAVFASVKRSR